MSDLKFSDLAERKKFRIMATVGRLREVAARERSLLKSFYWKKEIWSVS